MKKLVLVLAVTGLLTTSQTVSALGDKEKGALAGILGTLVVLKAVENNKEEIVYPSYRKVSKVFRCKADEITCAYRRGVWERERDAHERAKRAAYECGRTGICTEGDF